MPLQFISLFGGLFRSSIWAPIPKNIRPEAHHQPDKIGLICVRDSSGPVRSSLNLLFKYKLHSFRGTTSHCGSKMTKSSGMSCTNEELGKKDQHDRFANPHRRYDECQSHYYSSPTYQDVFLPASYATIYGLDTFKIS